VNHTCGWIHEGAICGKPAVEHVDIPTTDGSTLRFYLCADHSYLRDEIIDKHGSSERLPFNPFDE
jgi:hypothetical protein